MNWIATFSSEKATPPYLAWLRRGGVRGAAVWPGGEEPDPAGADALLLAGGGDIAPSRYGAVAEPETVNVIESRDALEIELVRLFIARGKPVFGICRGIQVLNVALGGGLIQHVPRWLTNATPAEQHSSTGGIKPHMNHGDHQSIRRGEDAVALPSRCECLQTGRHRARCAAQPARSNKRITDAIHIIEVNGDTRMGKALRRVTEVNSAHHQAADPARLAPGLRVVCLSPAGIIEAVESASPDGKLSAVQWHPERLPANHPASEDLLRFWVKIATQEAE